MANTAQTKLTCPNGHSPDVGWVHWENVGVSRHVLENVGRNGKLQIDGLIDEIDYEGGDGGHLLCNECDTEFALPDNIDWV